jgi:hypothetical protein
MKKTQVGVNNYTWILFIYFHLYGLDFTCRTFDVASGISVVILGVLSGNDVANR